MTTEKTPLTKKRSIKSASRDSKKEPSTVKCYQGPDLRKLVSETTFLPRHRPVSKHQAPRKVKQLEIPLSTPPTMIWLSRFHRMMKWLRRLRLSGRIIELLRRKMQRLMTVEMTITLIRKKECSRKVGRKTTRKMNLNKSIVRDAKLTTNWKILSSLRSRLDA